ncbi:MAG TPA: phosphotransferase [Conexibacter sp.]|nr:phosphotransferase [Conexibacter sp.]
MSEDAAGVRPPAVAAARTSDRELADALARALPAPVRVLARRTSPYASSFPLAELDVEAGDGTRLTVVWKDLTPGALLPGARAARGAAVGAPARELRAYELLTAAGLGTPRLIAAVQEPERAWLFLEAVRGARLEHVGDRGAWAATARWLAGAHAQLTACAADPAWPPAWAPAALDLRDPRFAPLAPAFAAARARLADAPPSAIHGELFPANVLIGDDGRVCVLDWETIARGPALLDLAALTAGAWEDPDEPLAEAYRAALPDPPPREAFLADLAAARLLTAAQWLAAPADWRPPPEHARDWLRDAEAIAGRIPA